MVSSDALFSYDDDESNGAAASPHYSEVTVKNVKGHFSVDTPISAPPDALANYVRFHSNFWTVRPPGEGNLVYVVFPKSGHVNVSGIKDFEETELARVKFEKLFGARSTGAFCVDNSTAVGAIPFQNVSPAGLYKTVVEQQHFPFPCTVSIRPHYFPSVLLRPKHRCRHRISTVILFSNGKFIIVGAKRPSQIACTVHNLKQIINFSTAAA